MMAIRLGRSGKARDLLLKKKPNNVDAIYYRALINYDQGQKEEAKKDFEKIKNSSKYASLAKGYLESIKSE